MEKLCVLRWKIIKIDVADFYYDLFCLVYARNEFAVNSSRNVCFVH